MDLVEVNGDFAPQYLAVEKSLDFNPSKTNINGRVITWNQPLAGSGSRIIAHTVHELRCRGGEDAGESAYIEGGQCITLDIWNSDWRNQGAHNSAVTLLGLLWFSHSVVSDCLWLHGLQHTRLLCPSLSPRVCSNLCSSSSSHPLLSPSPLVFNLCQHQRLFPWVGSFTSSAQSIGALASVSVFPMNIQGWFPLGLTCLISFEVQETHKSLLHHHNLKASILWCSAISTVQLSHSYMATGKTIALTIWTFVGKVMSLLFHVLSRLVITFLPRSKGLLISWLQPPLAVILETKNK